MNLIPPQLRRIERILLGCIVVLFAVLSVVGITWGLPSRSIDKYLFGGDEPWSGEKIYRLAEGEKKFDARRGADVDVDPVTDAQADGKPILLTETDEDIARIYLRYRLYTHQPDEMITMMALAGMKPRQMQLDPRLYQYGGLFIYPVGGLIGACGAVGLIDVRSDVPYYLDNPDEFGKFYVVARAYSAMWGMIGVLVVFAIARRLSGSVVPGLLAALLFTLMPVVVCMAHEGKPHLPGAVLMLLAVYFSMRWLAARPVLGGRRDWWLMCVCCGAAFGMVLSSGPIFVLIPLTVWLWARQVRQTRQDQGSSLWLLLRRTTIGVTVAGGVYLMTNPYIVINAITNRDVLASNFGNSLAMYQIDRVGEGLWRVLELTIEGVTLPVVVLGLIALVVASVRALANARSAVAHQGGVENHGLFVAMLPLVVPAAVFFLQFILIGAGKPAEYGRFGVFTDTALVIGAACLLAHPWTKLRAIVNWVPAVLVVIWMAGCGAAYLRNFSVDTGDRTDFAWVQEELVLNADPGYVPFSVLADPAPYSFPPINFSRSVVKRFRSLSDFCATNPSIREIGHLIIPSDRRDDAAKPGRMRIPKKRGVPGWSAWRPGPVRRFSWPETPISWANKPFVLVGPSCRALRLPGRWRPTRIADHNPKRTSENRR